jgi:hypothetical protein
MRHRVSIGLASFAVVATATAPAAEMITVVGQSGRPGFRGDGGPARGASIFGARAVDVGPDGTVYVLSQGVPLTGDVSLTRP